MHNLTEHGEVLAGLCAAAQDSQCHQSAPNMVWTLPFSNGTAGEFASGMVSAARDTILMRGQCGGRSRYSEFVSLSG